MAANEQPGVHPVLLNVAGMLGAYLLLLGFVTFVLFIIPYALFLWA
ncbi:MAG: hypothetical protein ABEJ27_03385 [Halodesulfurarchaeum sp.]